MISPVSQSFVLAVSLRTDGPDGEMNGFLFVTTVPRALSRLLPVDLRRLPHRVGRADPRR